MDPSLTSLPPFLVAYHETKDVQRLFGEEWFVREFWRGLSTGPAKLRLILLKILQQNSSVLVRKLDAPYRGLMTNALLACVVDGGSNELKLLAVKVLLGMSFDDTSSSLICFTPTTCEALVRLCLQHEMSELKEGAVQLLISWSNFPQVRLAFLENTELINSLIQYGRNSAFCKEWILKAFVNLVSSSLHKTLVGSNLVEWLINCAERKETNKIRNLALASLYNLTLNEFSEVLLSQQNLVGVLVSIVVDGCSAENVALATRVLESLASNRTEVQIMLFQNQRLMDRLTMRARRSEARVVRKVTMSLFYRLSNAQENEVPMFQRPFLIEALEDSAAHDDDPEIRHLAIETMNNLCCSIENNLALFLRPNLVETLMVCANMGETNDLKESAVVALQNLSYCVPSRVPLFHKPCLLDSLVSWVQAGETSEIKAAAAGTLYALSLADENRPLMVANRDLLFVLIDAARGGGTHKIRERANLSLEKLGCSSEVVAHFVSMCTLCSVRNVGRIGHRSSLRMLPKELVRKVAEHLYLQ